MSPLTKREPKRRSDGVTERRLSAVPCSNDVALSDVDNHQGDAVRQRLQALVSEMQARFGNAVTVRRVGGHPDDADGLDVEMTPSTEGALALSWFDTGEYLQVKTGGGPAGRWEMERTDEDAAYLEDIVRSVVAGRVVEVLGSANRSHITVTLSDGTEEVATGYAVGPGCLPRPGWKRKGRRVQYQPWG